jgi:hypothetical protein
MAPVANFAARLDRVSNRNVPLLDQPSKAGGGWRAACSLRPSELRPRGKGFDKKVKTSARSSPFRAHAPTADHLSPLSRGQVISRRDDPCDLFPHSRSQAVVTLYADR